MIRWPGIVVGMGHKGIRDGGPPRKPGFQLADVIGSPIARALIELAHEGFHAEVVTGDSTIHTLEFHSGRVRLVVRDGLVTDATVG